MSGRRIVTTKPGGVKSQVVTSVRVVRIVWPSGRSRGSRRKCCRVNNCFRLPTRNLQASWKQVQIGNGPSLRPANVRFVAAVARRRSKYGG
jgi:hypothetical protein